jgi:hypothetical protein
MKFTGTGEQTQLGKNGKNSCFETYTVQIVWFNSLKINQSISAENAANYITDLGAEIWNHPANNC